MLQVVIDELRLRRKLVILDIARESGKMVRTCREFRITRSTYIEWKMKYEQDGKEGLIRKKPITRIHPKLKQEVIDKIINLRTTYHFDPQRITWNLYRNHGIKTSCSTVYRTLLRQGMRRLPKTTPYRAIHTKRFAKTAPGHHIQVDVKFIWLKTKDGAKKRRILYTAIVDTIRRKALRIFKRHTQKNTIEFVDYVLEKFPFPIHTIRTDRGHEFQAQFHWHVEDLGIRHVYIKPRSPQLNGKIERSHHTDKDEFYQLLTCTNDGDLNKNLTEWEIFYNFYRPHGAFD